MSALDHPRPEAHPGAHVGSCLIHMAPGVLDDLVSFVGRLLLDTEVDPDLKQVLAALGMDAVAARYVVEDQLNRLLDGE